MKKAILLLFMIITVCISSPKISAKEDNLLEKYSSIATDKLMQMGFDKSIESVKHLNGGQRNSYLLFELDGFGYMIYYQKEEIFIEITTSVISPYKDLDGDLYYFGIGQYHINQDLFVYQVENEIDMKNTIESNIKKSKEMEAYLTNSEIYSAMSTTTTDTEISNSWYFEQIQENMPINYYGECGYVALAVYLGYFDQLFNDDIVEDTYENDLDPNEPTGTNQDFHDYLIILDGKDPTDEDENFSTNAYGIKNLTWDYIDDNSDIDEDDFSISWSYLPFNSTIRNAINNDTPSIIFFGGKIPELFGTTKIFHAAIAYGYNDDMFIVNLGYQGDNEYSRYYLSQYTIGSYMKMTYDPSSC
ncbi:MAG: hypothetical protein KJ971_02610 [Firmicutes bacterium]|nr:hypothetical protein [Bacillota bacterium]